MPAQTIRRRVDTEHYEDIAGGNRSFTVLTPEDDVQEGDYFVFVEKTEAGDGREVYRKVSVVVEADGLVVAGFVPIEFGALEGLLAGGSIVIAYSLEKRDGNTRVVAPAFLPVLAAPNVEPEQLNQHIGVPTWPDAQYSIMLRCGAGEQDIGRQEITIHEMIVMARIMTTVDDHEIDRFVSVDHRFLMIGALKDEFNNAIEPHFGDMVYDEEETIEYTAERDHPTEMDRADEADEPEDL